MFADIAQSPVSGAQEKIASLRYRHQLVTDSIVDLEDRVARNTAELEKMSHSYGGDYDDFRHTATRCSRLDRCRY